MKNKTSSQTPSQTPHMAMTATEYRALIAVAFPSQTKVEICAALQIGRAAHDRWLKQGISNALHPSKADTLRADLLARLQNHANHLHNRSRSIENCLGQYK